MQCFFQKFYWWNAIYLSSLELRFFLVTGYIWSVICLYSRARTCSMLQIKMVYAMFFQKFYRWNLDIFTSKNCSFFWGLVPSDLCLVFFQGQEFFQSWGLKRLETWTLYIWLQTSGKSGDIHYFCTRYTLSKLQRQICNLPLQSKDRLQRH